MLCTFTYLSTCLCIIIQCVPSTDIVVTMFSKHTYLYIVLIILHVSIIAYIVDDVRFTFRWTMKSKPEAVRLYVFFFFMSVHTVLHRPRTSFYRRTYRSYTLLYRCSCTYIVTVDDTIAWSRTEWRVYWWIGGDWFQIVVLFCFAFLRGQEVGIFTWKKKKFPQVSTRHISVHDRIYP